MADLRLGPSFPSVAIVANPTAWSRHKIKEGSTSVLADGTTVFHEAAQKWEWIGAWSDLLASDVAAIQAEVARTRTLALVDFDAASYTVIVQPQSYELESIPGTNPILFNLRVAFREK